MYVTVVFISIYKSITPLIVDEFGPIDFYTAAEHCCVL
jgi:hypothetical protein